MKKSTRLMSASDAAGEGLHEAQRFADGLDHAHVFGGVRRVGDEAQLPVLGMVQVGEAAVDQGADEVDGQAGAFVGAQEQVGIRGAVLRREAGAVDHVAAIAGQGDAVARFGVGGARLGVLAGEAADADDAFLAALDEHEAHLEEDLELAGDGGRFAVVEALGAVAALEQEAFAARGLGELVLEVFDFPTGDERREARQLGQGALQGGRVGIDRLLRRRLLLPRCWSPDRRRRRDFFFSHHHQSVRLARILVTPELANQHCPARLPYR